MSGQAASQNLLTRLTPAMAEHFRAQGLWSEATIYEQARDHARQSPSRPAIRDHHVALDYGTLIALADKVAGRLDALGLRPGDRLAAWLSSRVETMVLFLACSRGGYVFCPSLHRNHTVDEIATLIEGVSARVLFAERGYGADSERHDIAETARGLACMRSVVMLDPPAQRSVEQISDALSGQHGASGDDMPGAHSDDVVYLAFTSGTTGQPKGVMHSNNTLLANARALARDWAFDRTSTIYTLSPLSHNLGFGAMVLSAHVGGEIVVHDLPRGASLLDRLCETGASFVFGVPAHAIDLLAEIEQTGAAGLDRVRGFRISGAAAPPQIIKRLLDHGITPQSGYGMTEACSHHYTLPDDPAERIAETSGHVCPGYEIEIFDVDDADRPVPSGEIGQVGGRGASLMLGYFDNQTVTEASFNKDGWFMTGDLGRLDADGYLRITGRIKDVIIRGGHNIYPARIELLSMRHPGVERAVAVPVKDERLGEKVCIVVMPKNGVQIDPDTLLAHLHESGLSKYDMPEFYLAVNEIPLSASGKMLKQGFIPSIANGALAPQPVRWRAPADG